MFLTYQSIGSISRLPSILFSVFVVPLLFLPLTASADWSMRDAVGDAGGAYFSDLVGLEVTERSDDWIIRIEFRDISQGVNGALLFDLDNRRRTPRDGNATEARVEFTAAIFGICGADWYDVRDGVKTQRLNCAVYGNSFYVQLGKSLLEAEQWLQASIAALSATDFLSAGRDRAPDAGYIELGSARQHIQAPTFAFEPVSAMSDRRDDAAAPVDLKGVEARIDGEQLILRVHYHHSIDQYSIDDVSQGTIYLDLDGDLLSGLENTGGDEGYPTFGVDAAIEYRLYPWLLGGAVEADLRMADPSDADEFMHVQIGKFSTDSHFRVLDDRIEFHIPLALLPPLTADAVLRVSALDPLANGNAGFDAYPNQAGLRLRDAQPLPFLECVSAQTGVADPAGDSFAFGYDNDDIVDIRVCTHPQATLLRIRYTDLQLSGEAITALHLDQDRNVNTGEQWHNLAGDTWMGVESTFLYQFSGAISPAIHHNGDSVLVAGSSGERIRGVNALLNVNFVSDWVYLTLPHRLFNADGGGIDAQASTRSGAFGVGPVVDEAPDYGVVSTPDANAPVW